MEERNGSLQHRELDFSIERLTGRNTYTNDEPYVKSDDDKDAKKYPDYCRTLTITGKSYRTSNFSIRAILI